jgi:outer membrane immunogenic protein
MNKLVLAGVLGATFAAAAGQAQAVDWNGGYIGAQAGVIDMGSDWAGYDAYFGDIAASLADQGFVGGVFVGHNMEMGGFVLGAEADFNFMDLADGAEWIDGPEGLFVTTTMQSLASLRARIGIPADNVLFYLTGGVAGGTVTASYDIDAISRLFSDEKNFSIGWVAGAGVEAMLTDNVSVRLQGLYYDLGTVNFPNADDSGSHYSASAKAWVITTGLAWNF